MPPEVFGPFRVLHQIGAGALGPVFRAYDPERDRLVAVKLFRLDMPPERVHQLAAELETLVAVDLTHPAIVTLRSAGITAVSPYLCQDFVAADSLDLVFRESGAMPQADALRVVTQLASALDFAAAADILHGSLHPRDVLVSADDTRLTGLGIARALERAGQSPPLRRPYTAPERAEGTAWDRRADVFSLAVVAHEMIWGRRLAGAGDQAAQTLTAIEGGDLAALRRVFARALAEDPNHRFGSALAFVEELGKAFSDAVSSVRTSARRGRIAPVVEVPTVVTKTPADEPVVPERFGTEDQRASEDFELRESEASAAEPGEVDGSIEVRRLDDEEEVVASAAATSLLVDVPVVDAPAEAEHLLSYIDRASSSAPPSSALEASDSSNTSMGIRPLALALFLGVAIGFAGGYGLGYQVRPDEMATTINELAGSSSPTLLAMAADPSSPRPREFTEEKLKGAPAPEAPPPSGRIVVRSTPAGASVFIDGRGIGRTPITAHNLSKGAHDVRIARDGYTPVERRVVVSASKPEPSLTVALVQDRAAIPAPAATAPAARALGSLDVDSRPGGASVFVDGKLVGTTPISLNGMALGEYAVRLERSGYRSWASSVRVVSGEKSRVAASLEGIDQNPSAR